MVILVYAPAGREPKNKKDNEPYEDDEDDEDDEADVLVNTINGIGLDPQDAALLCADLELEKY